MLSAWAAAVPSASTATAMLAMMRFIVTLPWVWYAATVSRAILCHHPERAVEGLALSGGRPALARRARSHALQPFRGDRVGQQELRPARRVRALLLEYAEQVLHPADVAVGLCDRAHGVGVGLRFLVAAELEERQGRSRSDDPVGDPAPTRYAYDGQHDSDRDAAAEARRRVTPPHVRDLVRDDRRECVLVRHALDQPAVDHDVPAERGEGVQHARVVVVHG